MKERENQGLILARGDKASSLWDRLISKARHADFVAMVSIIQLACFLIGEQGYRGEEVLLSGITHLNIPLL